MMIIPEIETVVIFTPRTGSGSLRRALAGIYTDAMLLYRHMEADGVPRGYDRWRRVGIVREPVMRLWSLYKFLQTFDGSHSEAYIKAMRGSVARPFSDWLLNNETVFTHPYNNDGWSGFFPSFTVGHPLPENRKSQFIYLRPDLGTHVLPYGDVTKLFETLGVAPSGNHNCTPYSPPPALSPEARRHIETAFAWDIAITATEQRSLST